MAKIESVYIFVKQAKRSLRFEPVDETIAIGPIYLTKKALGFGEDEEIPEHRLPRGAKATFTVE